MKNQRLGMSGVLYSGMDKVMNTYIVSTRFAGVSVHVKVQIRKCA